MPSKAMDDLSQVPAIIASLGQAIAESQKQFDINYLNGIANLASIAKQFADGTPGVSKDLLDHLISTAAPPRYQFTETSLTVRLDLAESKQMAGELGIGFGFAGVAVNAAFSMSSSQNFRESAEIRTVIHAVLPQDNKTVFDALLSRAKDLIGQPLPDNAKMDGQIFEAVKNAAATLGAAPKKT